jgi:hypothetical protein
MHCVNFPDIADCINKPDKYAPIPSFTELWNGACAAPLKLVLAAKSATALSL